MSHVASSVSSAQASPVDAATFRRALGRFVSGVTVVSAADDDGTHGITVSSFMSLSLRPPLIGVSIDHRARAFEVLSRVQRFGVSVLSHDQAHVSQWFAGMASADDAMPTWSTLDAAPVVQGAIASLTCTVHDRVVTGDHTLFVGRVEATRVDDARPLAYWSGGYRSLVDR